jgi:hypothetical protein
MAIVGIVLWVLAALFLKVKINGKYITNPIGRFLTVIIAFPFVGVILIVIGIIGLAAISPLLHLAGFEWTGTIKF